MGEGTSQSMKDGLRGLLVTDIGKLERDRKMGQEGKSGSGERKVWAKKRREWVVLNHLCHLLLWDLG